MEHASPVDPAPLAHVHTFSAHSRSLVGVSSTDSYWCDAHTLCAAHVPGNVSVGFTFMYSVLEHLFTGEHTRFCVFDGAVLSYVVPSEQIDHAEQVLPLR